MGQESCVIFYAPRSRQICCGFRRSPAVAEVSAPAKRFPDGLGYQVSHSVQDCFLCSSNRFSFQIFIGTSARDPGIDSVFYFCQESFLLGSDSATLAVSPQRNSAISARIAASSVLLMVQVPYTRDADQEHTTVCRPSRGCKAQSEIQVNGKEQRRDR